MPDDVMISHRGASYAIGQGPQYYGIWAVTELQSPPLEWWHKTQDGWVAAWTKFTAVEVPGTIAAVSHPAVAPAGAQSAGYVTPAATEPAGPAPDGPAPAGPASADPTTAARQPGRRQRNGPGRLGLTAAGLLVLGVVLGVIGLFPEYVVDSLAQTTSSLVPHVIYLAGWTFSAVLIVLGGARLRAGALVAAGLSLVTFGLFFADLGQPISQGAHIAGAGLVISLLGWLACAVGSALAVMVGPANRLGRPARHEIVPLVLVVVAAIGAAIAFWPSWDSFTLTSRLTGASQTFTAGNVFANPAALIAGDVAVMVALFLVAAIAAWWRPTRLGGALVAGAAIPMVAQAIAAIVQIYEPVTPGSIGIPAGRAAQLGLTIHSGLTAIFWVFCAFVAILIMLCAWMIISPELAPAVRSDRWSPAQGEGWTPEALAAAAGYGQAPPESGVAAAAAPAAPAVAQSPAVQSAAVQSPAPQAAAEVPAAEVPAAEVPAAEVPAPDGPQAASAETEPATGSPSGPMPQPEG